MVALSECYLQKIEFKAIMEALNYKIAPKTFRRFVDDNHARFQERSHADKFLEILNKQDPTIKCTAEFEDHKHSLNFLLHQLHRNYTNSKRVPWVPNIGPKLRKEFKNVKKDITFTSGKNLQGILCQNNPKLPSNSNPGVYQLDSSRNGRYIGESKKKVLTRCIEHLQDRIKGNWQSSGATEHTKQCHGQFNWIPPENNRCNVKHV